MKTANFFIPGLAAEPGAKHLRAAVLIKKMCCPWSVGKGAQGSVRGTAGHCPTEETEWRVWKESGNAVAESTLNFTDSLQAVNISESREKHLSPIAATLQSLLLCLKWKCRLECGCTVGNAFQEEGASQLWKHRLVSVLH